MANINLLTSLREDRNDDTDDKRNITLVIFYTTINKENI